MPISRASASASGRARSCTRCALRLLSLAQEPASASELARRLGLPRQRVNYHVRELERGRLPAAGRAGAEGQHDRAAVRRHGARLRPVARAPRARSAPTGGTSPTRPRPTTCWPWPSRSARTSARAAGEAEADGKRIATLSLKSQFRFDSPGQRTRLRQRRARRPSSDVIARHSSPNRLENGRPGKGRPFRLVLACYPVAGRGRTRRRDDRPGHLPRRRGADPRGLRGPAGGRLKPDGRRPTSP